MWSVAMKPLAVHYSSAKSELEFRQMLHNAEKAVFLSLYTKEPNQSADVPHSLSFLYLISDSSLLQKIQKYQLWL